MEETWSQYKLKPFTMALYQENASVVYITSGTTLTTSAAIRKFYLSQKSSTNVVEQVHHKVSTTNKIIEEAEWIISFQHGECTWLLPNLDEHHFVNATVKIPVVISATFEDNLISSIRIYWDQASVLKQLGVISERNKWPVLGVEQVVALRSPPTQSKTAPASVEVPVKSNPGTNAFVPGRIFGPVHPDDQVRPGVRKPADNLPNRNIFSYAAPETKPLVAHNPNKLGSSFSLAHDEGLRPSTTTASTSSDDDNSGLASPSTPPVTASTSPSTRRVVPESRNIFAQYDENLAKKTASQLKVHDGGHIPSVKSQPSTGTRNIFTGQ